jgi:8-oxo-dGTP diphosphatase
MVSYEYPRPALTADVAVFRDGAGGLELLLVRRGAPPYAGMWALPGGFVEEDERPLVAASRELREETGMAPAGDLALVGVYGDPGRDPRGWTVTVLYAVTLRDGEPRTPIAGDDAAEAAWHPAGALPDLAFDHSLLAADAISWARARSV